jgi:hypothetical protein
VGIVGTPPAEPTVALVELVNVTPNNPEQTTRQMVDAIFQCFQNGYLLMELSDRIEPAASHATSVAVVRRVSRSALARDGCLA